jgi:5-hydroxyisourate hydrolase
MSLSTHVLDATLGTPAAGVPVRLSRDDETLAEAVTDEDGRVRELGVLAAAGDYRVTFDTGAYFAASGQHGFYPEVTIAFTVTDPAAHYHVPLLLSPYAYSTYRGS